MDILFLTTAPQHQAVNPEVELDRERLRRWLDKVIADEVGPAVRTLTSTLGSFNEMQVDDKTRVSLLELYREVIYETFLIHEDLCLDHVSPSAAQQERLYEDVLWLYMGLATGYKIVVKNAYDAGVRPRWKQYLMTAVFRAMELLSRAVIHAYRSGRNPPPLSFLEIHQLYLYAETCDVLTVAVKAVRRESGMPTVDRLYKQIMLLSIMAATGFERADVMAVYTYLEPFAACCRIFPDARYDVGTAVYAVDLARDEGPVHQRDAGLPVTSSTRSIQAEPVVTAIGKWIKKLEKDASQAFVVAQERRLLKGMMSRLQYCHA